jgi:hypothetical protein
LDGVAFARAARPTSTAPARTNRYGEDHTKVEQAANTLQPTGSSRHTTTANAKVGATVGAFILVMGRPYLFHTPVIKGVHVALFLTVH